MAKVDNLRNSLISKILLIRDEDLLSALDKIATASSKNAKVDLSEAQKEMIHMGMDDYRNGRTISQEELFDRELKWLNEK